MIYLFSQIVISLVLAAIVGAAAGWLTHRARADKHIRQLQQLVGRQQQHVNEAQTEVSILTGDFDDLKYRTDTKINELKLDNQQIPALNQNLEKSQLLVRQLMQKHTAELTELSEEKEKLFAKTKIASDREKELIKLQAELDIERRKNRRFDVDSASTDVQTELALNDDDKYATVPSQKDQQIKPSAKDSAASNADAVEIRRDSTPANTPRDADSSRARKLPLSGNAVNAAQVDSAAPVPSAAETEAELNALRDQLADVVSDKPAAHDTATSERPHETSEKKVSSDSQADDDGQLEPLFDAVDQHDDLKQIFGIGPVTEKTLNKLGITAYSQLAELKQHDIKKIADALQIIPGRIERDNWVGGARAQLEEVLEGL